MLLNEYKRNFFRLLNEGAAEMYRDSYYPEVDDYILEKIIEIDPESNGDDLSDFGKLLLKIKPQMSDFAQVKDDIAIYAKAVRNGVDVPDVKNVEELHYAAVDLANSNAHMSGDELNAQEESLGCPTVYNNGGYRVIDICNKDAAAHYAKGTTWIWGANNGEMFDQYSQRGKIYVIIKGNEKYSVIRLNNNRLRITNAQDDSVDKSQFPQEMLTALMGVNESKNIRLSENELMNMLTEAVEKKMAQKKKKQLTESKIKKMVSEAVRKSINEIMTGGPLMYSNDIKYVGDEWVIIKPSSFESAHIYGDGTQWCISASKRHWEAYAENGEFYFLITKNRDRKYIIYFSDRGAYFNDADNNDIEQPVLQNIGIEDKGVYDFFNNIGKLHMLGEDLGLTEDDVDDYDYDLYV